MPDPLLIEVWKPVVGYEDEYEVSNLGRIRSLDREVLCRDGRVLKYKGKILAKSKSAACHMGKRVFYRLGHLVLTAFVGDRPKDHICRHLDGNDQNSRLDNLVWGYMSTSHREKKWRPQKPGRIKKSLTAAQVHEIKELAKTDMPTIDIAKKFGAGRTTILDIKNGRTHADV